MIFCVDTFRRDTKIFLFSLNDAFSSSRCSQKHFHCSLNTSTLATFPILVHFFFPKIYYGNKIYIGNEYWH